MFLQVCLNLRWADKQVRKDSEYVLYEQMANNVNISL